MHETTTGRSLSPAGRTSRRTLLASAAAGAFALGLGGTQTAWAATPNPIPKLPGEVSRLANQVSAGGTLYDNIEVSIGGDRARIFVPQSVRPGSKTLAGVVWFYHATGSTHSSLNSAFKYPAELAVDNGAISICQNLGGSIYTNPKAVEAQVAGWNWIKNLFTIRANFLRANSGGGAMASFTLGKKLMPYISGLYMANSIYDVEERYRATPDRIGPAYNWDEALMRAYNPANLPGSAWTGSRIRVVVSDSSHPDVVLPQAAHGLALIRDAKPTALETTVRTHALGHQIPGWVNSDMISTFGRWLGR
ncbi:hypothetical protein [Diaminobutyricimonas aerilata]|nr:hypothetical protein [Diaminobutyricimonas aerilata]